MVTGRQIREARALLRWHRTRLALSAKLPYSTVKRAELWDGDPFVTVATAQRIQQVLESAGVEFTEGAQPGVRLRAEDRTADAP